MTTIIKIYIDQELIDTFTLLGGDRYTLQTAKDRLQFIDSYTLTRIRKSSTSEQELMQAIVGVIHRVLEPNERIEITKAE